MRRWRLFGGVEADRPGQRSRKGPLELDGGEQESEGDVPVVLTRSPARAVRRAMRTLGTPSWASLESRESPCGRCHRLHVAVMSRARRQERLTGRWNRSRGREQPSQVCFFSFLSGRRKRLPRPRLGRSARRALSPNARSGREHQIDAVVLHQPRQRGASAKRCAMSATPPVFFVHLRRSSFSSHHYPAGLRFLQAGRKPTSCLTFKKRLVPQHEKQTVDRESIDIATPQD